MDWFFKVLAYLLPTQTVEGAIKVLVKAGEKLAIAEEQQTARGQGLELQIANLQAELADAAKQAADASRIRRKISALID